MKMKYFILGFFALALSAQAMAQCNSQQPKAQKVNFENDIIGIATSSDAFSTLVAAVKAAGLVSTLQGEGPFTVFAPVNTAFAKLPAGTVETLLKPENKATLTQVLTYHVVAGEFKAADVIAAIKAGGGKFTIKTVSGGKLVATLSGGTVILSDENGGVAAVTQADVDASNGVVHVIDSVVLPK